LPLAESHLTRRLFGGNVAEDRNAGIGREIGGLKIATNFDDEIRRQR
jgi:hypothetical protein